MNDPFPHQLRRLDEALLALLDERRRMTDELAARGSSAPTVALDDLLRRHAGPFPAADARAVFEAVQAGCTRDTRREREATS